MSKLTQNWVNLACALRTKGETKIRTKEVMVMVLRLKTAKNGTMVMERILKRTSKQITYRSRETMGMERIQKKETKKMNLKSDGDVKNAFCSACVASGR